MPDGYRLHGLLVHIHEIGGLGHLRGSPWLLIRLSRTEHLHDTEGVPVCLLGLVACRVQVVFSYVDMLMTVDVVCLAISTMGRLLLVCLFIEVALV